MQVVDYNKTKEKIENYYRNSIYVEQLIDDDRMKQNFFNAIFHNNVDQKNVKELRLVVLNDITVIKFETYNYENNRVSENILITEGDNPVFQIEHSTLENNDIKYNNTITTIYKEDNYRIASRIKEVTLEGDIQTTQCIDILDEEKNPSISYYSRKYRFFDKEDKTAVIFTGDTMYLDGQEGFTNTLEVGKKKIEKIIHKIDNRLDSILGEKVKTYQITRKKQGQ